MRFTLLNISLSWSLNPPQSAPKRFNVPHYRNPNFTGREKLLSALHETLGQTGTAALNQARAIDGLGGIGKTQTAIEYAFRYFYDQPAYEWVFWVKADTDLSLSTDFGGLADALALPGAALRWLETNDRWLLIFDNADDPALVNPYRPRNPNGRILLTSRAQVFDQVGIVQPLEVQDMTPTEARAFLLKRTERELPPSTTPLPIHPLYPSTN